jgi:hypothetical protein
MADPSNHRRHVAIRRPGMRMVMLVVLVSCRYPYQQRPYQQASGDRNVPAQTSRDNSDDWDDSSSADAAYSGESHSRSSEWSCRAVGSYAPPSSDGAGPDYSDPRNVDVTKWGGTRDEAGIAAIDACSGLLELSANATISPGSLVLESCRVLRCSR